MTPRSYVGIIDVKTNPTLPTRSSVHYSTPRNNVASLLREDNRVTMFGGMAKYGFNHDTLVTNIFCVIERKNQEQRQKPSIVLLWRIK